MDKNAIKKYAIWARNELIKRVTQKAKKYDISEEADPNAKSAHGVLLSPTERRQRGALVEQVRYKGFAQVMEEVAYTWFNRFCALRFMEVNNYLPSRVRVFTAEDNAFRPQILSEAIHVEIEGLDREKVLYLKENSKDDELYKYLLITQCNALSGVLPGLFQKIADYTELLFPDNLLRAESAVEQVIALIPEEDWRDQVQIIGWLYQYYNTEKNELVYDGNMSKEKIPKELIPAATTIYTPDWPIRYMVENSLGRLWIEGHPNEDLQAQWRYYLGEAEQEPEVQAQLAEIRKGYAALTPKSIRCIDPCAGSGHICVYLFDVLMQIYEAYGYTTREAVKSIVANNLYGLDIDDRAAQLAYFSVMMKACQYDRRFLSRGVQPHVYAVKESNHLDEKAIEYFCNGNADLEKDIKILRDDLYDAKEYGSILPVSQVDFAALYARFDEVQADAGIYKDYVLDGLLPFVRCAEALSQKYHVTVTNPPYLGSSRFSPKLTDFVKNNYPDEKSDLSMVMYKRALTGFAENAGFVAFITTSSWMFLSSFEKLRTYLFDNKAIASLVDYGTELFEGKVGHNPIVSWVTRNNRLNYNLTAVRLVDFCYSRRDEKEPEFFEMRNRHTCQQGNFSKIPRSPMAYWWNDFSIFEQTKVGDEYLSAGRNKTHNNDLYVRNWWEISDRVRWQPYANGGNFRRWAGNDFDLVDWSDSAKKNYDEHGGLYNQNFCGKTGVCWNLITSSKNGFRIKHSMHHYSSAAPTVISENHKKDYVLLAYLNSCMATALLSMMNPTLNTTVGDVLALPIPEYSEIVDDLAHKCVHLSQQDWDSFETSWDFQRHPLLLDVNKGAAASFPISSVSTVAEAYTAWQNGCNGRFAQLKANEEELNRIFIDIYGLQDELTPDVDAKDVTVHYLVRQKEDAPAGMDKSNYLLTMQDVVKSLISYAVGCMFGRYSLDCDGLVYAGGEWDASKYHTFPADKNGILPICDDEYFENDIVNRFVDFLRTVYGEASLTENLRFIADALGGEGQPKEVIRNYFLNGFYGDHCKTYQKRPIYWLFDSGRKNGFKCLVYMHRWERDTVARVRTSYLHEQQGRYRTIITALERRIANTATSDRVKLNKRLKAMQAQAEEARLYEEKIHHFADRMININLDDGVKHNYQIFKDVLAKIK